MMSFVPLLLVGILFPAIQAKQFTKCELSQVLKDMAGYGGITLPEFICTIFHISGYDTQTIVDNNGSTEYGLFQISNKYWCRDHQIPQSKNTCDISCDIFPLKLLLEFLDDDLTDDMICAKKILDSEGIGYWPAHKPLCSEKLEQWLCEKL